jgi:hypothetical protein
MKLAQSIYFSRALGFVFFGASVDREASMSSWRSSSANQSPDGVVQSSPKILDGLRSSQGNFIGNALVRPKTEHPLSRIRIQLWNDSVRVAVLEGGEASFQITDVLFGPFDLCPSAV